MTPRTLIFVQYDSRPNLNAGANLLLLLLLWQLIDADDDDGFERSREDARSLHELGVINGVH